jgi:formylglycine-generating enzyme required for sulfatase activity
LSFPGVVTKRVGQLFLATGVLAAACNDLVGNDSVTLFHPDGGTEAAAKRDASSPGKPDAATDGGIRDSGAVCVIDGGTHASDAANPANPCEICNAGTSPKAWIDLSGTSCNGSGTCASGTCVMPASCAGSGAGVTDCGTGSESCCESLEVPAGSYDRSYDGFTYTDAGYPATVSGFRLDRYEVTVARFRSFVAAVVGGWVPGTGLGKHAYLNGGMGLNATGGGYESGWMESWTSELPNTADIWNSNLNGGTWTPTAGANEKLPVTHIDWYDAYAFCIWDGGFLPTEAEWNEAAAGGADQRAYPWSPPFPPGSTVIACTNANYSACPDGAAIAVGSDSPKGDGKWGQSDLGGNVWEWNLDYFASYVTPCTDCANFTMAADRSIRGGSYYDIATSLLTSFRFSGAPDVSFLDVGFRCARSP